MNIPNVIKTFESNKRFTSFKKISIINRSVETSETSNTSIDDTYFWDTDICEYVECASNARISLKSNKLPEEEIEEILNQILTFEEDSNDCGASNLNNISESDNSVKEELSLVTLKENRLLYVQQTFKKSIRISLKSFLISISLSFLNLFI